MSVKVTLHGHEESYEVRYSDGRPSIYFHFDDDASRRAVSGRVTSEKALTTARAFAMAERERLSKSQG